MDAEKGMKEKGKGCSSTSAAPPRFDLLGDVENAQVSARDQLQKVINLLSTKRNILVLVGAGISTACGIKDFRSSNGLYSTIESEREYYVCTSMYSCMCMYVHIMYKTNYNMYVRYIFVCCSVRFSLALVCSAVEDLGLTCAEDLFDLEFFTHNPVSFTRICMYDLRATSLHDHTTFLLIILRVWLRWLLIVTILSIFETAVLSPGGKEKSATK